jgi:hypothetical protein
MGDTESGRMGDSQLSGGDGGESGEAEGVLVDVPEVEVHERDTPAAVV